MRITKWTVLWIQILMLVIAISVDALGAGFVYGVGGVRMPVPSVFIVSAVSALMLGLAMAAGNVLGGYLAADFTAQISFLILFVLGLVKLFQQDDKRKIREADRDKDHVLAAGEAVLLGAALSLDSVAAGIGVGVEPGQMLWAVPAAFVINFCMMQLGGSAGRLLTGRIHMNLNRMSGLLLMALAIIRVFF